MYTKQQLRAQLKFSRNIIKAQYRSKAVHKLTSNFINAITGYTLNIVGSYYPIYSEISPLKIMAYLNNKGIATCLPIIENNSMKFRLWKTNDPLYKNGNLFEPDKNSPLANPELIIVPLLGFNRDRFRIGYGKGFYDFYIKNHNPLIKIGIAFAAQEVKAGFPIDDHDEKLDMIITEQEIIKAVIL